MTDLSRVVVVDVETSGLDPARHGILEIGACFLDHPAFEGSEFEMRCRLPGELDWEASALAVNGIDRAALYDPALPSEREMLRAFFAWVGATGPAAQPFVLAGMNPGKFDRAFLEAAMRRYPEVRWPQLSHRTLDLHSLAIGWAVREQAAPGVLGLSTDAIYTMLGLPEEPKPHRALTGARMERAAFRLMLALDAEPAMLWLVKDGDETGLAEEILYSTPDLGPLLRPVGETHARVPWHVMVSPINSEVPHA